MIKIALISLWRRRYGLYPLLSWLLMLLLAEHIIFLSLTPEQELAVAWYVFWWVLLLVAPWWLADWFEDGAVEQYCLSPGGLSRALWLKLGVQGGMILLVFGLLWWAYLILLQLPDHQRYLSGWVYLCSAPPLMLLSALFATLHGALRQQASLLGAIVMPLALPWLMLGHTIMTWSWMGLPTRSGCLLLGGMCCVACALLPWVIHGATRMGLSR